MFNLRYRGLQVEVSLHASRELIRFDTDLQDVIEILETGFEARKRKKDFEEKYVIKGRKIIKVVAAKCKRFYENYEEEVWRVIHVGKTTLKRKLK